MRRLSFVLAIATALGALGVAPASAAPSFVFQVRFTGLVADATWTTCPSPSIGALCQDTIVLAFDATTSEKAGPGPKIRSRGPVLRTLTFVYRVVGGDVGTVPVAEWFGRTEDAQVSGTPQLTGATAVGTVPIDVCSVFDPTAGVQCPSALAVDLTWTGVGPLTRTDDHSVFHGGVRTENTWTRGTERDATVTGSVGTAPLSTLLDAGLARVDQGETVVQHPVG
jgi:hypothetical protein